MLCFAEFENTFQATVVINTLQVSHSLTNFYFRAIGLTRMIS